MDSTLSDAFYRYGLAGLVVYILAKDTAPMWSKWFIKTQDAKMDAERDERADRRKRDDEDRQWNRQMTERLVVATEGGVKAQVETNIRLADIQRTGAATREDVTTLLIQSGIKAASAAPMVVVGDKLV